MSPARHLPHLLFGIVCRKWAGAVVDRLAEGTMRFGDLARAIPGLSRRVLGAELRRLADEGMVRREEVPGRRTTVRYSLTASGVALHRLLRNLHRWEGHHLRGSSGRVSP